MARPLRVEFPGAVYHVTARGNEGRLIFRDDEDRRRFLGTLEEAVGLHELRLHGYCLMPNHYHLLLETPRGNLSRALGWLQTTYTVRFNQRHRRSGHLFQGRFKAHLVEADIYAKELLRYVHLNPVRPRDKQALIPAQSRAALGMYHWSSHQAYLGRVAAPEWLCMEWLSFFGRRHAEARRRYARFVEDAFGEALPSPWAQVQMGLVLGGEALREKARALLSKKPGRAKLQWGTRAESPEGRREAAQIIAAELAERPLEVWARVQLGGERRVDVARACGYRDGSAVTQILKRLQARAAGDPRLRARLTALQREFTEAVASVTR